MTAFSTPSAALAWEFWRRHRQRLMTIAGLLLGFAVIYPKLCALAGFNLNSDDALEEILIKYIPPSGSLTVQRVVYALYLMFLACGPIGAMCLALLCMTWMFTLTAVDPKTKDPMAFPARLFDMPLSTNFLFWLLFLSGQASIALLYTGWTSLVRLPHLDIFSAYGNCVAWLTLMALAQGISWSMASWPISRMIILSAMMYFFFLSPVPPKVLESVFVLPPLFLLGAGLARTGLQKMRHGEWQG